MRKEHEANKTMKEPPRGNMWKNGMKRTNKIEESGKQHLDATSYQCWNWIAMKCNFFVCFLVMRFIIIISHQPSTITMCPMAWLKSQRNSDDVEINGLMYVYLTAFPLAFETMRAFTLSHLLIYTIHCAIFGGFYCWNLNKHSECYECVIVHGAQHSTFTHK